LDSGVFQNDRNDPSLNDPAGRRIDTTTVYFDRIPVFTRMNQCRNRRGINPGLAINLKSVAVDLQKWFFQVKRILISRFVIYLEFINTA